MPRLLDAHEKALLTGFLADRFGIPPLALAPWQVMTFSRQAFLVRRPPAGFSWESPSFVRAGLPFLRDAAGHLKPTTCFVQRFGHLARRNHLELKPAELEELCLNGEIILNGTEEQVGAGLHLEPPGYVMIHVFGRPLGCCLLLEDGRLLNRLPKAIRQAFRQPGLGDISLH